jgi:predicted RND superfamily exporter protein
VIGAAQFLRFRRSLTIAVALITVAAAIGASRLVFDDSYRNLFRSSSPEYAYMQRVADVFGADDQLVALLIEGHDVLSADVIAAQRTIQREALDIPGIVSAHSVLNLQRRLEGRAAVVPLIGADPIDASARERLLSHPLAGGYLVDREGRRGLMVFRLSPDLQSVDRIAPVLDRLRALADAAMPPPNTASVTGLPSMRVEIVRSVARDQVRFNVIGLTAAMLVSYLLFRRIGPLFVSAAGPMASVLWTLGALGWMGERINPLNNIVPQLILVIAFTDSSHYLFHIGRARAAGLDALEAAVDALRHLAPACLLTMITTTLGFLPLALLDVEVLRRFGLACALGSVISFVAVATVVPLIASSSIGARLLEGGRQPVYTWTEGLAMPAFRSARLVAAVAVIVFALLATGALQLRPDYRYSENLPPRNAAFQAMARADAAFGGVTPVHVVVEWPEGEAIDSARTVAVLQDVEAAVAASGFTGPPMSALNFLRAFAREPARHLGDGWRYVAAMPADVRDRWIRSDLRMTVVSASVPDSGAATLAPHFDDLEARVDRIAARHPGYVLRATGMAMVTADTSLSMIANLGQGLGAAALAIFAIIAIGTRSLRLGVISILPNVLPLAGTACVLYTAGLPLQYISAAAFCICLGLATDDSIHFLSAFRRARGEGRDVDEAVRASLRSVGTVMITTSLLLASGFSTLMTSELPTVRRFGALSCTILLFSIAGDLVVMPALLRLGAPRSRNPDVSWF